MTEQTTEVGQTTSAEQTTVVEQTAPAERTEPEAVPQTEPQPDSRAAEPPAVTPPAGPEAAVSPLPEEPSAGAEVIAADEPQVPPVKVRKDRRVLRAVLRWTAATVVFAAVGSSVAYGITGMERTDVPGLATRADGRWDYPTITKPPLPSGSPGPFAKSNKAGAHYADLRKLLLPAPKGAEPDAALRGEDGWLPRKTFLAQFAEKLDRDAIGRPLSDNAVRHIAARGWTTADGTHTRIYLLQFNTAAVAEDLLSGDLVSWDSARYALSGAAVTERDEDFPERAEVDDVTRYPYTESKPYGAEQVREAYLSAGDTIALVVQSRKGVAKAIPFQQTVVLQSQLLG
jgi:hypothetical protein